MYAKVTNGQVEKYPYTVADLMAENPNTSFPVAVDLTRHGAVHVVVTGTPDGMVEGPPEFRNGRWEQTWVTP